jgi:hypothetical protein
VDIYSGIDSGGGIYRVGGIDSEGDSDEMSLRRPVTDSDTF